MTALHELLDRAAGDAAAPVTAGLLDDDVARGRRALRARRLRGAAAGVSAVAAVAALSFAGPSLLAASGTAPAAGGGEPAPSTSPATPGPMSTSVQVSAGPSGPLLVPADRSVTASLPIRPDLVPDGWSVTGTAFALVISPPDVHTDGADLEGKLVVMLADTLPTPPASGYATAEIGDRKAWAIREGDVLHAWVRRDDGRYVEVQAPISRDIDEEWLGRFLAGVTVTPQARVAAG